MNGGIPDFAADLLEQSDNDSDDDRPCLAVVVRFENSPAIYTSTDTHADLARLAEHVRHPAVLEDIVDAIEDFANEHVAHPDISPWIGPVLAGVIRLELRERLQAIITELDQVDADVDVPRTIAEGALEDLEALLAEENGVADDSDDEAEAA